MINIMITGVGTTTAHSVIKGLKRANRKDFMIIGTDINEKNRVSGSIFCDKFYKVPYADDLNYINKISKICYDEEIDLIIPIIDQEVEQIARNKTHFDEINTIICCSDFKTVEACNDKLKTYLKLKEKGIITPRVYSEDEIKDAVNINFPLFIKPRRGRGSIGCYRVDSIKELEFLAIKIEEPIIQEHLTGSLYVIDILNNLEGENLVAIPRHEFMSKSGVGVKAKIVRDKNIEKYAKTISEAMEIKGVANIEVFENNGNISLIEINPRFSAGSIISTVAGVNLPEIVIDMFLNKNIQPDRLSWKDNLCMIRYWEEVYYED